MDRTSSGLAEIVRALLPLSWLAFGGPQAHVGMLQQDLIVRRGWTDEMTFTELLGLCSILPGPTSTQLVIALGALRSGLAGAVVALLTWMFPASLLATLGGIGLATVGGHTMQLWLAGVQSAAVALVALAAWTLGRKLVTDRFTMTMCLMGALVTLLSTAPLTFPLVLAVAALAGQWWAVSAPRDQGSSVAPSTPASQGLQPTIARSVALAALGLFVVLLVALPLLRVATGWRPLVWFDAFYRAGALVFGGGQVLLSVLLGEITGPGWLSQSQFLTGVGLAQSLPGPLFSIGGFAGGVLGGVGGAVICLVAIFLPGLLLTIGLLPFWQAVRHQPRIRLALIGINGCSVGLIISAAILLYNHAVHTRVDAALLVAALGAAAFYRLPAPLVIVGAGLIGWPLHAWLG